MNFVSASNKSGSGIPIGCADSAEVNDTNNEFVPVCQHWTSTGFRSPGMGKLLFMLDL